MTTVEVFADVVCPFAYVGLTRLVQRRAELGRDDVRLHVRAWPLEIVNGRPVDPHFIGEEVDEIREQVAPDLFTNFDPASFPASSVPAMALTAVGYRVGPDVGEQVALHLRRLLFEEATDVAEPAVLASVAASYGLPDLGDRSTVEAEHAEGQRRGVVGSPHFFTHGSSMFCPTLDIQRVDESLRIGVDQEAFDRFVEACFG